jgi:hypothetical protein
MRTLMFRRGSRENPDRWRARGYPDFNGSLYQLFTVPALRTRHALRDFLATRYPRWRLSDADVAELLHYTGGFGRMVHLTWLETGGSASISGVDGIERALPWLRTLAEASGMRRMLPSEAFASKPLARTAVTAIILHNAEAVEADAAAERHALPCIGMSTIALMGILGALDDSGVDAAAAVRELIDYSLLYEQGAQAGADAVIQLARPCDAHIYADSTAPDLRQLFLLSAVHLMVSGIADDSPSVRAAPSRTRGVTHVNAGAALEELVRPGIARLLLPSDARPRVQSEVRCINIDAAGLLCLWQPSGAAGAIAGAAGCGAAVDPAKDGAAGEAAGGAGAARAPDDGGAAGGAAAGAAAMVVGGVAAGGAAAVAGAAAAVVGGVAAGGAAAVASAAAAVAGAAAAVAGAAAAVAGGAAAEPHHSQGVWVPLTPATVATVDGKLLSWTGEIGLDGVLLCRDVRPRAASRGAKDRADRWLLHGWQCKGGQRTVQVTGGEVGTSVKRFENDGVVEGLDDTTSHGILVKAQVGMCRLLHAWQKSMKASGASDALPQLIPASSSPRPKMRGWRGPLSSGLPNTWF